MPVPMMNVRIVGVTMMQYRMGMEVIVRFFLIPMRVVRIMAMAVLVFKWFVPVRVLVSFRHVQPRAKSHQCSLGFVTPVTGGSSNPVWRFGF